MTGKSDFTDDQWEILLEAPPAAGLLVITSDRGGSILESFSMAKGPGGLVRNGLRSRSAMVT